MICIKCFGIIKVISTFTLSNWFLVWMAKKVLVYYDLDLILIKYYKKRLKAQLKNRKIYINKKNLTEFIILLLSTHLLVLSD